ncbi:MAG: hypothetical protein CMG49_04695 [Candidatus Marinimicrobia bacterium]|nr:hypothetical protein [Candidatus Neomarinimicrobiota bacterium]
MSKFLLLMIFLFGLIFSQDNINKIKSNNNPSSKEYIKLLEKSLKLLKTNYVDSINESEVIISGIKGLMKELDPYTKLLMSDSKASYDHLRKGKYGGIGIQIGMRRDTLTVLSTFENSPAYSEGIQIGDNILMIDSTYTKNLTLKESSNLIKGELDSIVTLSIYRSVTKERLKFDLKRSNIPLKNVPYWGVDDNGVGYIRINRFSKNSDKDFKQGLEELSKNGLKSLIIDLRGNSGGLLSTAINILDNLTNRGDDLLSQKGKTSRSNREWKSRRNPILSPEIPLIILINKRSASASEIVAGTIQDLDRGIVLGEKSFGKGLVQHMYDLNDSTTLKVTTAKFYLPSGRLIQKQDYLDNGFLTDGLDKIDSTFTTKNGREVKGGGGIIPDVKTSKNKYSPFVNALYKEKVFLTFATDFIPRNPDLKEKLANNLVLPNQVFNEFKKFLIDYDLKYKIVGEVEFEKMKNNLLKESISINKYSRLITSNPDYNMIRDIENYFKKIKQIQIDLSDNKRDIKNGLLREFCRLLFDEKKRIAASLKNDVEYNKAVEILNEKNEYYKLLGY